MRRTFFSKKMPELSRKTSPEDMCRRLVGKVSETTFFGVRNKSLTHDETDSNSVEVASFFVSDRSCGSNETAAHGMKS